MRAAVYTRFWDTAGGGEVYAGTFAEILGEDHEVDLLCESTIDVDRLNSRLGLDLSSFGRRAFGDIDDAEFSDLTAGYDLFVNCSHGSQRPNGARLGLYVVHFPDFGPQPDVPPYIRAVARRLRHGGRVEWGPGFNHEESDGVRSWRWTSGRATLRVHAPRGRRLLLELDLSKEARPPGSDVEVVVEVAGVPSASLPAGVPRGRVAVPIVGDATAVPVTIATPTFSPGEVFGVDDPRELGVQLERATLRGTRRVDAVSRWLPEGTLDPEPHEFLGSYQAIVSNSAYTAKWIKRRWRLSSSLVEPPVRLRAPGDKERVILSVGRFFGPESGHSKRQLEMVRAFGAVAADAPDWRLHLVGGCSDVDRPYLEMVEKEIGDLPVTLHVNTSASELDDLYARAGVYWHATGLNEDAEVHPERMEHFGISVVEAMSAGAVPVVLGVGGPAEVVRRGVDGLHFTTAAELVSQSIRLVRDDEMRARMAASSVARASAYGREAFARKARSLVSSLR